jgi:hypothetical protein
LDKIRWQKNSTEHDNSNENYQKVLEQYKKSDNYAAYQEKVAAWKKAKKTELKAAKSDNKKKVIQRKK